MIYLDSRYADATVFTAWDSRKSQYNLTCFRNFPRYRQNFFMYEYVEKDRLDVLAHKFLNNPGLWHEILDINPEIINPNEIAPGTLLRIPNA